MREHRLYQADWLMRFYGFEAGELVTDGAGNLDLARDPKLAWALANRGQFPVDVNAAPREMLLRVPGMGVRSVERILLARKHRRLRMDDLARLHLPMGKVTPFIVAEDHRPGVALDSAQLAHRLAPKPVQGELFAAA